MEQSIEDRLLLLANAIGLLREKARGIVTDCGDDATTPCWNMLLSLAEAGRACVQAALVEQDKRKREASHA